MACPDSSKSMVPKSLDAVRTRVPGGSGRSGPAGDGSGEGCDSGEGWDSGDVVAAVVDSCVAEPDSSPPQPATASVIASETTTAPRTRTPSYVRVVVLDASRRACLRSRRRPDDLVTARR